MKEYWAAIIREFEAFLISKGLTIENHTGPDRRSFGNEVTDYVNAEIGVRIESDRGRPRIDIADVKMHPIEWYPVYLFRDLLKGFRADVPSFTGSIHLVETQWERIIKSFSEEQRQQTHTQLRHTMRERAKLMHPTLKKFLEGEERQPREQNEDAKP